MRVLGNAACLCKGPEVKDERDVCVKFADVTYLQREPRQGAVPLAEHPHLHIRMPSHRITCITLQHIYERTGLGKAPQVNPGGVYRGAQSLGYEIREPKSGLPDQHPGPEVACPRL